MQDVQQDIENAWKYFVEISDASDRTTAVRNLLNMPAEKHPRELRWLVLAVISLLHPRLGNPRNKKNVGGLAYFLYSIVSGKDISGEHFTVLLNQNPSLRGAFQKNEINDWLHAIEALKEQAEKPCLDIELDDKKKRISRQSVNKGYNYIKDKLLEKLEALSKDPEEYRKREVVADAFPQLSKLDPQILLSYGFGTLLMLILEALNAKWDKTFDLALRSAVVWVICLGVYAIFHEVPYLSAMTWLASLAFLLVTYVLALWLCVQLIWIPVRWIDERLFPV